MKKELKKYFADRLKGKDWRERIVVMGTHELSYAERKKARMLYHQESHDTLTFKRYYGSGIGMTPKEVEKIEAPDIDSLFVTKKDFLEELAIKESVFNWLITMNEINVYHLEMPPLNINEHTRFILRSEFERIKKNKNTILWWLEMLRNGDTKYIGKSETARTIGVSEGTLYIWEKAKKINPRILYLNKVRGELDSPKRFFLREEVNKLKEEKNNR